MKPDADLLIHQLACNPENLIVRGMLRDELMDVKNLEALEAEQIIDRSLQAEVDALHLALATHLMKNGSPVRDVLTAKILLHARVSNRYFTVLVITGGGAPRLSSTVIEKDRSEPTQWITVGGQWITSAVRYIQLGRKQKRWLLRQGRDAGLPW